MASCPIIISVVCKFFLPKLVCHMVTPGQIIGARPTQHQRKEGNFIMTTESFFFGGGEGETTQVFGVVWTADAAADAQVGMWNACM